MTEEIDSNLVIATKYIWTIVSPILILTGTVANVLSIVVLNRKKAMSSNSTFYLAILPGANIFMLYFGLLPFWTEHAFQVDILTLSDAFCRLDTFLVYYVSDFISWTLVIVAVDRCVNVCLPLRAAAMCTRKRAKLLVSLIAIFFFVFNFHILWGIHVDIELGEITCTFSNYFTNFIWSWIDLFTYSVLPFVIMVISNVIIVGRLRNSKRRVASHAMQAGNRMHQDKISAITRTVQLISITFLIRTLPSVIYEIYTFQKTVPKRQKKSWDS